MSDNHDNHLVKGLRILGERWSAGPRAWIAAAEDGIDAIIRWVMVGGAGYLLWRLVSTSWKSVALVVLIVIIKALRAATKAAKGELHKSSPVPTGEPTKEPGERLPQVPKEEFLTLVRDVLGTAKGVHLATLTTALGVRFGGDWEIDDVRALCGAAGVRVRPGVRNLGSNRVSPGVHRDDVKPLPQPLSEGAQKGPDSVVDAGQPPELRASTTAAPTPTYAQVGDLRITSTPDAVNPHRTHITVIDPTRKKASK